MRIAIALDDEPRSRAFAERARRAGSEVRLCYPADGDELRRVAREHALDAVVFGVLNRADFFFFHALQELAAAHSALTPIGIVEAQRPSLHEAAEMVRELPALGFVSRPDSRFDHLLRRRPFLGTPPTFASTLLECVMMLPLRDIGRDFALLQAVRPSVAFGIPEQAAALGAGRRKLERWFQGPDVCSPRRLQAICAAAEAVFLRSQHRLGEREIAAAIGAVDQDGFPSPLAVRREIRSVFGEYGDRIRERGLDAVVEAVRAQLRKPHDAGQPPARWEANTRYRPADHVLVIPEEGQIVLVDSSRGLRHPLDGFGMDAWDLLAGGATFGELIAELTHRRAESRNEVRIRLKAWLGELLVLELLRRDPNSTAGAEGA
jgi:hypothetical protein